LALFNSQNFYLLDFQSRFLAYLLPHLLDTDLGDIHFTDSGYFVVIIVVGTKRKKENQQNEKTLEYSPELQLCF